MSIQKPAPIAIGGVGGSGTRVFANAMMEMGWAMGGDLNPQLDNVWYSFLFRRRSALLERYEDLDVLIKLFLQRMSGEAVIDDKIVEVLRPLAETPRLFYSMQWLADRFQTFLATDADVSPPRGQWGWKEPNSHIFIRRFLAQEPSLKYIHVMRHGLDMSLSENQQQLLLWGPVFLDLNIEQNSRNSLSYWCAVHRRIDQLAADFPGRVLELRYEDMCADPDNTVRKIADFAGAQPGRDVINSIVASCQNPGSIERWRQSGIRDYNPADLAYVASKGYAID